MRTLECSGSRITSPRIGAKAGARGCPRRHPRKRYASPGWRAALRDKFLFEAACDERRRSWHPKFAVMRWTRPEDKARAWRAWLGSRNLTRDLSRDAGLLLAESADANAGSALLGLRSAVEGLQS